MICYYLFVTFNNIRRINLNEIFDLRFVLYAAGTILAAIFLLITVSGKLIGMPLIFLTLAIYLGFDSDEIVALVALYGSPTAVISAVMAEQLGCDRELAAQVVIFSTVISCITIFGIVFILSFLKVI